MRAAVEKHTLQSAKVKEQRLARVYKHARPTVPPALAEADWIALFKKTHLLVSQLYSDKTHIEILCYLRHVEVNLILAGYTIAQRLIKEHFSLIFPRLGFEPAKGRDSRKFVSLRDRTGRQESFVLLKLGCENG